MYYYCSKCRALIHPSEVTVVDGVVSHSVMSFVRADGSDGELLHTGLVEDF